MAEEKPIFQELYSVDISSKVKKKNNLSYVSWAAAWAEVKKKFPDASYHVYSQRFTKVEKSESGENETCYDRPWFDDGRTGWVRVGVTIKGQEQVEELPIMDYKNTAIPADKITSTDANKSAKRCLAKACAVQGLGLFVYEGEDIPEETKEIEKLRSECVEQFKRKASISEAAKIKANEFCKAADPSGDPRLIEDAEILKTLKKQLLGIRK